MATFTITNLTAAEILMADFYATIAANGTLVLTDRFPAEITVLRDTQIKVAAGTVSLAITYTAAEIASGMLTPPNAVAAEDMAAVAAADVISPEIVIRKAFTAGVPGTADDVVVIAANALPYKMRILHAELILSTFIALSTATVQDEAAGAGTTAATFDTAVVGIIPSTAPLSTTLYSPGTTKGLFLRRSDRGIAGELVLTVRRES